MYYHPETEEGRKLLAHELTHVAQNSEKNLVNNKSTKELEKEAINEEKKEIHDPTTESSNVSKRVFTTSYKL